MNVERFNGSDRAARINAQQHLTQLESTYEAIILQAAREAASNLQQQSFTAAASGQPNWQLPAEGVLLATTALVARATKRLSKIHRQVLAASARPPLARVGISWDVTHPLSQHLLDQAAMRTGERLAATVQPVLRETVLRAYQDGLSVADTAAAIRDKFAEAAPGQAQMLARTDLNSLANGGSVMAATMAGAQFKQWLTAADERVRETHVEADGQTVPIDQPFDVGGESLDYPGDPSGSDEEVCNCRCTVIYVDGALAASGNPRASVHSRPVTPSTAQASRIPSQGFRRATPVVAAATEGIRWQAVLAVEGEPTEDGRMLAPGSITWRDLPLTLKAQMATQPGHDGAEPAGRIDRIWRDGSEIMGAGVFDSGEFGAEVARMVEEQTLRGVSVDLAVREAEMMAVADDGTMTVLAEDDDPADAVMVVTDGVIGMATVCGFQAIGDASISILDERLASALGALTHVTEMAARLGQAQQRTQELEQAVRDAVEERKRDSIAQKTETLALIESLTERIAAGEQISEAMRASLEKSRKINIVRDENGRAAAYEVVSGQTPRTINIVRDENGRAAAYEVE